VAELTIFEIIPAAGGEAETLPGVVTSDQSRKSAPVRSIRIADDNRSILAMVVAEYISDGLGASIACQQQPRAWNLPACVAMLSADQQMLEISVQFDVLNRNGRQTVADPDHGMIGARDFANLQIGHLPVSRQTGLAIKRTEAQPWLAEQPGSVTKNSRWLCQAAQLKKGRGSPGEKAARGLFANKIGPPAAERDRASAATLKHQAERRECPRVIGRSITLRTEILGSKHKLALRE